MLREKVYFMGKKIWNLFYNNSIPLFASTGFSGVKNCNILSTTTTKYRLKKTKNRKIYIF